jgi:hypothetical protein
MKIASILLVVGLSPAFAADDLPKPISFDRYQTMLDRSPFAVATAVAAPVATPNFAKDLYVANAAHSKDGDMITIASNADKNFKKYVATNAPDDGYSISSIEWSDKVGATKVTISKDGQFATLTFNEALLKQPIAQGLNPNPPQQVIQQPQVGVPGMPGMAPSAPQTNFPKPMPVPSLPPPGLPTPPPRVRGVIPRNPAPTPVPIATPQEVEL